MRSSGGDGGFSGLAVFSLLVLMIVLAAAALVSLHPWATTSQDPNLSVSPGIGVGLGDAVVASRERPHPPARAGVAVATPAMLVSVPASAPGRSGAQMAVAQLQPVAVASPPPAAPPPSEPEWVPSPEPIQAPAAPSPASTVVVGTDRGANGPGNGIAAGVDPGEACEGDEYEVVVVLDPEAAVSGEAEVEIVIRRVEDDRSEDEVQLTGEPSDVLDLLGSLVSEGDCAQVEVEYGGEAPVVEGPFEVPGEIPYLEEALEPVLP